MHEKHNSVLIVCPVYAPHAGGGGQYFPLLAQQLKKISGINDVAVLTERHPDRPFRSLEEGVYIYRFLPQRDSLERKGKVYSFLSFFLTYVLFYIVIPVLMWKHKAGVLHYTRYLRRGFYGLTWLLLTSLDKTVILDMRATVENPRFIYNLFGYSAVISNSLGVFQQMERLGVAEGKHYLVPNPVLLPEPIESGEAWLLVKKISEKIRRPYLAFVGQLLERKSINEVLDAFDDFSSGNPEFQLVLAGRNMLGASVERKIKANNNILHLGPIPREQALALMQEAEMILQPSKIEGIPRVSLEALALGKKVLLPPCVPEFVAENELFTVKEITPESIQGAIVRILEAGSLPKYDLSVHGPDHSLSFLVTVYQNAGCFKEKQ